MTLVFSSSCSNPIIQMQRIFFSYSHHPPVTPPVSRLDVSEGALPDLLEGDVVAAVVAFRQCQVVAAFVARRRRFGGLANGLEGQQYTVGANNLSTRKRWPLRTDMKMALQVYYSNNIRIC